MQIREKPIWELSNQAISEIQTIAEKIASELLNTDFFCLWLMGNIGAGKTTLTGAILRSMGLPKDRPVTSPTFTYLSDYKLNKKAYAHLDFYRLDSSEHPISDLLNYLDYDGLFVEWPENLGSHLNSLSPTHVLRIEKGRDSASRNYTFSKVE